MAERPGSIPESDIVALLIDVRDDVRAGFGTLHAKFDGLNQKIDLHARDDVTMEHKLRNEIAGVRDEHSRTAQAVAKIAGERDAEGRFGAPAGTGRFQVVPPARESGPAMGAVPPPPGGISINIGEQPSSGSRKSRSSVAPIVEVVGKFFSSGAGKMGAAAALLLMGYLSHYVSASPETKIITVAAPPPAPVESMPAVASAVATYAPLPPPPLLDAGTKKPVRAPP